MKLVDIQSYLGPSIYSSEHASIKPKVEVSNEDVLAQEDFHSILQKIESGLDSELKHEEWNTEQVPLWYLLPMLTIELLLKATGEQYQVLKDIKKDDQFIEFVLQMDTERVASNAIYDAVDILNRLKEGQPADISQSIDNLERDHYLYSLGPSTQSIVSAAKERDIPAMRLNQYNLVQLGYGSKSRKIEATITDSTSFVGMRIAQSKMVTKTMLKLGGLPVPKGAMTEIWEEAKQVVEGIDAAVVIKPADASKGRGATTDITSLKDAENAFLGAKEYSNQVLIEEHITGNDYRILVIGNKVVAVSERKPASVRGDGEHTVRELIILENENPLRGSGHELPLTRISIDNQTELCLRRQGMDLDSVPEEGADVVLKTTANLSTGGYAIDRTDEIHPVNETIAVRAARLLGMDVCGVDVIAPNVSESWYQNGGRIIELNASPGFRMHVFPWEGKSRNPGSEIVSKLFSAESSSRIPIIPITGTNGKTTVTLLVSHILRLAGYNVGTTTTEGIYVQGSRILKCDCTGPWSAEVILKDATVDVAVLETARGGILKRGLGFDRADISAVLNVSAEHLGEHGIETVEEMAAVKGLLYETTRPDGWAVVNCDDDFVWEQSNRSQAKKIGFSTSPTNSRINALENEGAPYVTVRDNEISIHDGERFLPIASVDSVPITFEGIADFNIENALAGTAFAYAMGVSLENIRAGLLSFAPTPELNPGRSNMLRVGGFNVLIDYAHNKAAMKLVSEFLFKLKERWGLSRLTAAFSLPGNRKNQEYQEIMKIVANTFDEVYIKEDQDTRGRERGELAQIMEEALLDAGMPEDNIHSYFVEPGAIRLALQHAVEDELIFVNFESFDEVYSAITSFREERRSNRRPS